MCELYQGECTRIRLPTSRSTSPHILGLKIMVIVLVKLFIVVSKLFSQYEFWRGKKQYYSVFLVVQKSMCWNVVHSFSSELIWYSISKQTFPFSTGLQEQTISFPSRDLDKILTKIDIPSSGSKRKSKFKKINMHTDDIMLIIEMFRIFFYPSNSFLH